MQNQVIHKLSVDEQLNITEFYLLNRRINKEAIELTLSKFMINYAEFIMCQITAKEQGLTNLTLGDK